MLKKLQAIFFGLSIFGLALVIIGMIIDTASFWMIADLIIIGIFAGNVIVYYQSLRK